jgi:hypothetical protein
LFDDRGRFRRAVGVGVNIFTGFLNEPGFHVGVNRGFCPDV